MPNRDARGHDPGRRRFPARERRTPAARPVEGEGDRRGNTCAWTPARQSGQLADRPDVPSHPHWCYATGRLSRSTAAPGRRCCRLRADPVPVGKARSRDAGGALFTSAIAAAPCSRGAAVLMQVVEKVDVARLAGTKIPRQGENLDCARPRPARAAARAVHGLRAGAIVLLPKLSSVTRIGA